MKGAVIKENNSGIHFLLEQKQYLPCNANVGVADIYLCWKRTLLEIILHDRVIDFECCYRAIQITCGALMSVGL